MIISPEYGPQFDRTDGTIGDLQLVKRWCIGDSAKDGQMWTPRQGRYTYESEEQADSAIKLYQKSNPPDRVPSTLVAVAWWCYPGHFDPCGRCELESTEDFLASQ